MVDAADHEKLDAAKNELQSLLEKPQLSGIPVNVLALSFAVNVYIKKQKQKFGKFKKHLCSKFFMLTPFYEL